MSSDLPTDFMNFLNVDVDRASWFNGLVALGRPFDGCDSWPQLSDLLHSKSRETREQHGQSKWQHWGGILDGNQMPSFAPGSPAFNHIIRQLFERSGGIRMTDSNSIERFVCARALPDDRVLTYSIPASQITGVRLSRRSTQLLWIIHDQVRRQRSSRVWLPDDLIAEAVWGRLRRPRNWRRDVHTALNSLKDLSGAVLGTGTQVDPVGDAVVIDVVDLGRKRSCPALCSRHGNTRHGHFLVNVAPWFLGAFESLEVSNDDGIREYNWNPDKQKTPPAFENASRRGRLIKIPRALGMLGPAKWSDFQDRQLAILFALFREQTKSKTVEERIPKRNPKQLHHCSLIRDRQQSVGFNGNGRRSGLGYGIVGRKQSGWLSKCGISWPEDPRKRRTVLRRFIADCRSVANIMDLDIVAFDAVRDDFVDGEEIERRIRGTAPVEALDDLQLRFYGHPEPHRRLEEYLGGQGGFVTVTDSITEVAAIA